MTNGSRISQLTMIRSNVNKLRRLLQQILDFRKVESGNMKLSVSKSDVISFIDDVCKIHFTPLMRKKNQTFTFLTEDRHLMAYFDRIIVKFLPNLLMIIKLQLQFLPHKLFYITHSLVNAQYR